MRTIGSELARYRGIGPGFDHLRVGLAFSVIALHVPGIVLGNNHVVDDFRSRGWWPATPC